jgi:HEAT repeat protein
MENLLQVMKNIIIIARRAAAACALWQQGSKDERVVGNLLKALEDENWNVRHAAAVALGQGKPYLLSPKPLAALSSGTKSGWDMYFQVTEIR